MARRAEHAYLPAHFDPEEDLLDQLGIRPGHQRVLEGASELLVVVHEVPKPDVRERQALFFWKTRRDGWRSNEVPGGLKGLADLLERYTRTLDELEEDLEEAEKARDLYHLLRRTLPVHRSLRNLTGVLESVLALEDGDRDILALRDRARELERAAELLNADAHNALDYFRAESAEEQAEAAERTGRAAMRLNLLAAVFLPMVAVAGIFGMNVRNGLENSHLSFWLLLLLGLAGGAALFKTFGHSSKP